MVFVIFGRTKPLKRFVVDTNTILSNPELVETLDGEIYVPYPILSELDKIKQEKNERGFQARRGVRTLKKLDNVRFDVEGESLFVRIIRFISGNRTNNDDKIVTYAKRNKCALVTADIILQMKAKTLGVEVIASDEAKFRMPYTGYKRVHVSQQELADFYSNVENNKYGLLINQYLLLHLDDSEESCAQYRWDGNKHVELKLPDIKGLRAKNDLQKCALDLLNDDSVPVKMILGNYGSGKTMLTVKVALDKLKKYKSQINSITMVRNPIGSGEAIGFLKGDKNEKTEGFFKPIIQHLDGGEQESERMEQMGQLVKEIPFFLKGMSLDNTFILCDEIEDFSESLVKLVGTRLGNNSQIAMVGDFNQTEDKYKNNNGIMSAVNHLKGNTLVGIVVLEEDLRSDASRIFADLM